ncbi:hypothetical protein IH979_03130 [Patescibacteria group bacterium]|nr:hypothetical protein [Patescibacteria group bacterium]
MFFADALFWFVLAFVLAALEIEIESKHGWAQKLPTWYRVTGPAGKIYKMFMSGKPLTGYHLYMQVFTLLIFHIPFFSGFDWTLVGELKMLALFFVWVSLWDYLWFVLNPAYGWRRFRKENVWWHATSPWLFGLFPFDYLSGVGLSYIFIAAAGWLESEWSLVTDHTVKIALFLAMTALTALVIAPAYHRWYNRMREMDDRDKVNIFHD